jgi:MalT-like TPR region
MVGSADGKPRSPACSGRSPSPRTRLDLRAAETRYRQALVLATELEMRPLVAHCHLGLGQVFRQTGERERAQEHLHTAVTMFRAMDMGFWLEKVEAETRELT